MKLKIKSQKLEIKIKKSFLEKTLGLMFKKEFNHGIMLVKCNSIHTFFMKKEIDVIMTDKNYKVLYVYNNLKKNKIILPKKNVYYTFEIPSGLNNYKINETLKIS